MKKALVQVNGLFGSSTNWRAVERSLRKTQQGSNLLVLASNANLRLQVCCTASACDRQIGTADKLYILLPDLSASRRYRHLRASTAVVRGWQRNFRSASRLILA